MQVVRAASAVVAGLLIGLGVVSATPRPASADVTTYGGDALRTGWYADQPGLGPSSVSSSDFGQLFSTPVDGQVYAQPLVSAGTLFVATETNNIYGLDPVTGALEWTRNLGVPFNAADVACGDLTPYIGITGTPVIDPATNTAYFFSKTYVSGASGPAVWWAHAVDVATGAERAGFPLSVSGTASNARGTQFSATNQMQRTGLALIDGVVYAGFGGHCDVSPYQGWIVGVSTLGSITTMWSTVAAEAGGNGSGIWQSGGGLVSDRAGSLVFSTGNGSTLTAPASRAAAPAAGYGESVVRLNVQPDGSLAVNDFFTPYDADALNGFDGDLGSGAPVALPPSSFGTASFPRLMVEVGKEGYLYVLNADDLGGYKQASGAGDAVLSRVGPDGGVWAKPTPWGGDGGYVYVPTASPGPAAVGSSGYLHAYKYGVDGTGKPTLSLAGASSDGFGFGSGSAIVTSDGSTTGSAVVWTIWMADRTGTDAQLRAYDPVPVNGTMQLLRSFPIGTASKFAVPGVSANRLYLGTRDGRVLGFGRPINAVLTGTPASFPATTVGQSSNGTVAFTVRQATTVTGSSMSAGPFAITGASTPPEGTPLEPGETVTYPVSFTPSAVGNASGTLTLYTAQGIATAALTGTGRSPNALLQVVPTAVSFGGIATGTSRSASITLSNAGAQTLTIGTVTAPAAPFSASGAPPDNSTIPAGGSVSVTLTFAPTSPGSFSGQFVVSSNGGTVQVDLSGAAGAPGHLQVTPTALSFPDTPANGATDRSFTVANTGGTDLTITKSKPPSGGAFIPVTALAEGTRIPAGASLVERVRFNPTAAGSFAGTFEINGDGTSSAVTVSMTGRGTPNAGIPPPSSPGWIYNGSATQQGPLTVLTTADLQQQAGTAFWPQAIDPTRVTVSFDLTIGQGTGADGATFALVPPSVSPDATGIPGRGLGWFGLGGVAVVFDTYRNTTPDEPSDNYVGIVTDLDPNAAQRGILVAYDATIPPLRNTTTRVDITVTPGHIEVSTGGVLRLSANVALPASARVGFTAATGGLTDRHVISNVSFSLQDRMGTPNRSFVYAAYTDFLSRPPSAGELDSAASALDAGTTSRSDFVGGLASSSEWVSAMVQRLYQSALGRPADPGGLTYWTDVIRSGRLSVAEVGAWFYSSEEYHARSGGTDSSWVTDLYAKLLNRTPDEAGHAYWVQQTAGVGRFTVAFAFFQSAESAHKRVADLYAALLGRSPDPGGWDYWADQVVRIGDIVLARSLAASDEYFSRARLRYP